MITAVQLAAAGLARSTIAARVKAGRLHPVHRGVYAVGHARLSQEGRWLAAVLACGEGAVLSHRSAAELWRMLPSLGGPAHVTVAGEAGRARRKDLLLHRSPMLRPVDCTRRNGIPVTRPGRTLADLERVAEPAQARQALRQAEFLKLPLPPTRERDRTRSELERRFLAVCRRHGLPRPEVNVPIDCYTVDFLWRDRRLAVETDGYGAHRGRGAFEDDRARDLRLKLLGYDVVRFTDRQLKRDAKGVADALRRLL